jgi:hypothetical protein
MTLVSHIHQRGRLVRSCGWTAWASRHRLGTPDGRRVIFSSDTRVAVFLQERSHAAGSVMAVSPDGRQLIPPRRCRPRPARTDSGSPTRRTIRAGSRITCGLSQSQQQSLGRLHQRRHEADLGAERTRADLRVLDRRPHERGSGTGPIVVSHDAIGGSERGVLHQSGLVGPVLRHITRWHEVSDDQGTRSRRDRPAHGPRRGATLV